MAEIILVNVTGVRVWGDEIHLVIKSSPQFSYYDYKLQSIIDFADLIGISFLEFLNLFQVETNVAIVICVI